MNQLGVHTNYLTVRQAAEEIHRNQRSPEGISDNISLLARLYVHGFRGEVIGAFHATAEALEQMSGSGIANAEIQSAVEQLRALGALSRDPVPRDGRAVSGIFYTYDQALSRVLATLDQLSRTSRDFELRAIRLRFVRAIERITARSGIAITRDDEIPEQASFIVPSLGITIVPLVYGDQHSWNTAFLSAKNIDVPRHLHRQGIEIHLGIGAVHGESCLAGYRAKVSEGYAMPIPPGAAHGFINRARHEHRLPFIFGSRRLGGWGIIPDVEPQPINPKELALVDIRAKEMNGTVLLNREIQAAANETGTLRRTLIPPDKTFAPEAGGISLSIARVAKGEMTYQPERFQIVSVARGRGKVAIGPAEAELAPHAHFGIPAGARATITATGREPLVLLDAILVEELR